MTVDDGLHSVCRLQMIITGDCLRMGDAAANQHGVEAEGMGAANVRCKLVADHYHISGATASQGLLKDDSMGLTEPVKVKQICKTRSLGFDTLFATLRATQPAVANLSLMRMDSTSAKSGRTWNLPVGRR